jgi:Rod binding domain-containing protein
MSTISPQVGSSLDFQGLGELRAQAQRDQRGALRETARQFEAMFIQTIMATMREAGFKSDLVESSSMETFQAMHDKEISLAMTRRGGLGLADMLVDQMERNKMVPAAQALAQRGNAPQTPLLNRDPLGSAVAGLPVNRKEQSFSIDQASPSFKVPHLSEKAMPLNRPLNLIRPIGGEQ